MVEPVNILQRCRKLIDQSKSISDPIDDALAEFARGTSPQVVSFASRLVESVRDRTSAPEVTVDVDGALAFDLRLRSGDLMFGELQADGGLSVTVLDDRSEDVSVKKYFSPATEAQFVESL